MEHYYSYDYDRNHAALVDVCGVDTHLYCGEASVLALQFGRVEDAKQMIDDNLIELEKVVANPTRA